MKHERIFTLGIIFCAVQLAAGCGLRGNVESGPIVQRSFRTVNVRVESDGLPDSPRVELVEVRLRTQIALELFLDGRLAVVDRPEEADVQIQVGKISREALVLERGRAGEPVRGTVRLQAAMVLRDLTRNGRVGVQDNLGEARADYDSVFKGAEAQAAEACMKELARRIVAKALHGWYTGMLTEQEKRLDDDRSSR
jgi:hypothetical protein